MSLLLFEIIIIIDILYSKLLTIYFKIPTPTSVWPQSAVITER